MTIDKEKKIDIEFGNRIVMLQGILNLNRSEFARRIGTFEGHVRKWESNEAGITAKFLLRICNEFGVSANWILYGEGPMFRSDAGKEIAGEADGKRTSADPEAYTYIPLYNVKAHGGGGAVISEEKVVDALAFKKSWISQELLASREDLFLIYMEGESMEPTLHAKDILLVDRRDNRFSRESIYVIREDDTLLVKRVKKKGEGRVELISDNPAYSPREIDLSRINEDSFEVIGRVVWIGRRI